MSVVLKWIINLTIQGDQSKGLQTNMKWHPGINECITDTAESQQSYWTDIEFQSA